MMRTSMKRKKRVVSPKTRRVRAHDCRKHVQSAHRLLTGLRTKLGQTTMYAEIEEAIAKLEYALSILTIQTRGLL